MQTRRQFIRNSALAASSISLFHIGKAGVPANETIRHASFGASGMAFRDARNLSSHPNLELVAVAEVDERKLSDLLNKFPRFVFIRIGENCSIKNTKTSTQ